MQLLLERFYLNGKIIRFHPQSQKFTTFIDFYSWSHWELHGCTSWLHGIDFPGKIPDENCLKWCFRASKFHNFLRTLCLQTYPAACAFSEGSFNCLFEKFWSLLLNRLRFWINPFKNFSSLEENIFLSVWNKKNHAKLKIQEAHKLAPLRHKR